MATVVLTILVVSLFSLIGCGDLLDVDLPERIPAEALETPERSSLLVESAIADFECAFDSYAVATGLMTDELILSTEFAGLTLWDLRRVTSSDLGTDACGANGDPRNLGVYIPLSTARFQADNAYDKISSFDSVPEGNKQSLLATAAAYAGYSTTLLGESFCRAAFDVGPAVLPDEALQRAEDRFTTAIESAREVGNQEILNMALVGRARARLNLGRLVEAAEDAELVPQGFVKMATYGTETPRRWNDIQSYNRDQDMVSVGPDFRDLQFSGVDDPRVKITDADRLGNDGVTEMFLQSKVTSLSDQIPIASWKEAQLILAEVAARKDNNQKAVEIINKLHARAGLPDYDPADHGPVLEQVLEERKRELFFEGHRFNDILRTDLEFPSGTDHKGREYGQTTCLPLPDSEIENNPNIDS